MGIVFVFSRLNLLVLSIITVFLVPKNSKATELDSLNVHRLVNAFYRFADLNADSAFAAADQLMVITSVDSQSISRALALNVFAGASWLKGDYIKAKKSLMSALLIAHGLNDSSLISAVENTLGILDIDLGRCSQSTAHFYRSLEYTSPSDLIGLGKTFMNQGIAYMKLGKLDSAQMFLTDAHRCITRQGDSAGLGLLYYNQANLFYEQGEGDRALTWSLEALNKANTFSQNKTASHVFVLQAKIYRQRGELIQAEQQARKALFISHIYGYRETERDALEQLYLIFQTKPENDSTLKYLVAFQNVADSLLGPKNVAEIYFLELEEKENERKRMEWKANQAESQVHSAGYKVKWMVFSVCVLMISFLLFAAYSNKKLRWVKSRYDVETGKRKHIETELELKNRTLLLKSVEERSLSEDLRALKSELNKSHGAQDIKAMVDRKMRMLGTGADEWLEFRKRFVDVHPNFLTRLLDRHPELSKGELRLAALLSMNMTSKQMARLLHINPTSVDVARHRLRKKMNLKPDQSLNTYLIELNGSA